MLLDGSERGAHGNELGRRYGTSDRVRYDVHGRRERRKAFADTGETRAIVAGRATAQATGPPSHAAHETRRCRARRTDVGVRMPEGIHMLQRRPPCDARWLARHDRTRRESEHKQETR